MKNLYLALIAPIKNTGAKWIDFDSGQLESADGRKPLKFPCALLRFAFTPNDVTEESDQREKATITLRLAFDATGSRTSADTPDSVLARSLDWTTKADALYNALQGLEPSDFEQLESAGRMQEPRADGLVVWKMTFTTARWLFKS
jgi:hypothetical protein